MADHRRRVVIFPGSVPPPPVGTTLITEHILNSRLSDEFDIVHVDTSDHRDDDNMGVLELRNALLAVQHGLSFLTKAIRRKPDLAYVMISKVRLGFLRDSLFLATSRLLRIPVVAHFQSRGFGEFFEKQPAVFKAYIRWCFPQHTHFVVLGNAYRSDFRYFAGADRIHVAQNGVPDLECTCGAGERDPIVMFMSTLSEEKGTLDLLRAAPAIRQRVPAAKFVIYGNWRHDPEAQEAKRILEDSGMTDAVEYCGTTRDGEKSLALNRAAVLALPTKYPKEGQPLTIMDAFSTGTPVVSTPIATIPEILADGVEGMLVEGGNVEALADRISLILSDTELRDSLGSAARSRFESDFTLDSFASRLARIWGQAIGESPAQHP